VCLFVCLRLCLDVCVIVCGVCVRVYLCLRVGEHAFVYVWCLCVSVSTCAYLCVRVCALVFVAFECVFVSCSTATVHLTLQTKFVPRKTGNISGLYILYIFFFENVYCFEVCSSEIHVDTGITKCSQFTILHELCLVLWLYEGVCRVRCL